MYGLGKSNAKTGFGTSLVLPRIAICWAQIFHTATCCTICTTSYSYSCGELVESYLLESVQSKKTHITVLVDFTEFNIHFFPFCNVYLPL